MSVTVRSAADQAAASIEYWLPKRWRIREQIQRVLAAKDADREREADLAVESLAGDMPDHDDIFWVIEEAMGEYNSLRQPDPPPASQEEILAALAGWIHAAVGGCPDEHCPAQLLRIKHWAKGVHERARRAGQGDYLRATFNLVVGEAAAV